MDGIAANRLANTLQSLRVSVGAQKSHVHIRMANRGPADKALSGSTVPLALRLKFENAKITTDVPLKSQEEDTRAFAAAIKGNKAAVYGTPAEGKHDEKIKELHIGVVLLTEGASPEGARTAIVSTELDVGEFVPSIVCIAYPLRNKSLRMATNEAISERLKKDTRWLALRINDVKARFGEVYLVEKGSRQLSPTACLQSIVKGKVKLSGETKTRLESSDREFTPPTIYSRKYAWYDAVTGKWARMGRAPEEETRTEKAEAKEEKGEVTGFGDSQPGRNGRSRPSQGKNQQKNKGNRNRSSSKARESATHGESNTTISYI